MNTDERRAKIIAFSKFLEDNLDTPENRKLFGKKWMEFIAEKRRIGKPQDISDEFYSKWK